MNSIQTLQNAKVGHGGFLKGDFSEVLESLLQEQFGMFFMLQRTPNRDAIRKVGLGSSFCSD